MSLFSPDSNNTKVRRRSTAAATLCLLLGAVLLNGCDSDEPGATSDDGGGLGADAQQQQQQHACSDVSDDVTSSAQPGPHDGVYATIDGNVQGSIDSGFPRYCMVRGSRPARHYYKLERGSYEGYYRTFDTTEQCVNSGFDSGGVLEEVDRGAWRGCGPTFTTADGVYQQAVRLAKLPDGTLYREYFFFGSGPANSKWHELLTSTVSSSAVFTEPPSDIRFLRHRRPK